MKNHKPSRQTCSAGYYPTLVILITALLSCHSSVAQSYQPGNNTNVSIVSDPYKQTVLIEVNQDKPIANLLVLIVDGTGHTVFLDDKSDYKGVYKNQVDLAQAGSGEYNLQIIADREKFSKKLVMR